MDMQISVEQETRIVNPVPVEIKNWAEPIKPPTIKNTTIKTYILDPAATERSMRFVQISEYEPRRKRMSITVIDAAVALTMEQPNTTPDVSTATLAPQGQHLPISVIPVDFYGPDAFWLNSLAAVTRVTVVKEYC